MEENRRQAPLYGQVEVLITLQNKAPEEAELYVAVQGSELTHVTSARRRDDGVTLSFTAPGHDHMEDVSVTSFFYAEDRVRPCEGEASLEYLRNVSQEAAEYLSANRDQLGPQSYLEVLKRFSTSATVADQEFSQEGLDSCGKDMPLMQSQGDDVGLRRLDEEITLAMANLDYFEQWKNTHHQPEEGEETTANDLQPQETLLHLAVRLGLVHLVRFLSHQPRGQRLLTLPNQDGDTALELARRDRHHEIFRVLTAPPGHAVGPVPGVWCVWSDSSCMLSFCPGTNSLTLTLRRIPGSCPQDAILILRERQRDPRVLKLIKELKADSEEDKEESLQHDKSRSKELQEETPLPVDNVFEEQLSLSLDDDEEEYLSTSLVNGRPTPSTGVQSQFDQCASDHLLLMMDCRDQSLKQQTEVGHEDIQLSISGVTSDSTGTDGGLWNAADLEDPSPTADTPPLLSEDPRPLSSSFSLSFSPADQALSRLTRPTFFEPTNQREHPPMDTCDLSLVSLELEEDSPEPKPLLLPLSSNVGKSENEKKTCRPCPDLTCTRTQSASSACESPTTDVGDLGIRLRSYSYSSPKITLRPARFPRDNHPTDMSPDAALHSHSRPLLQALSLSKSLSLLHLGKQRPSLISEQSHDKRDISFHKQAQSADDDDDDNDEGSLELAESLQHLTLSEFLKEYVDRPSSLNRPLKTNSYRNFQHICKKAQTCTE